MITLNKAQTAAVEAGDGPALVLAGAGSGKTRVIVERILWLIAERGVDPRNILALTFTNKAAGEMRQRVQERLGVPKLASWIGTFHSFGLFLLRREMERLDRPKDFTIFDADDQLALIKRLIKGLPSRYVKVSPRDALSYIGQLKQELKIPDSNVEAESLEEEAFRELWGRYDRALRAASAVDFDDLLRLPARLLDENDDVRQKYQRRYRYILIDEYQDTNHAQYWIAKRLSEGAGSIFAVGDEDQSIYSWRGADIRNILEFTKDFPEATIFKLEQNYRSTKPILDAANAVVASNTERLGKTLWTEQQHGTPVALFAGPDAHDEARYVADTVAAGEYPPDQTAVLYRTNGQSRLIEEALRRKGIAYVVVGGIKFYARKEVKDLLAYLRLLANPNDNEALRRIINVPRRGIGTTSVQQLEENARARATSLLQALRDLELDQSVSSRLRSAAAEFIRLIDDLALQARSEPLTKVVEAILDRTGYRAYVEETDEKDFKDRLDIVEEFVNSCADFDARSSGTVLEYLQELALVSDVDSYDDTLPAVTLMTCHSAKGLEFDCVFLVGMEEGLLPHATALESDSEMEEERRLCYVAMTRARRQLHLAYTESRVIYGETRRCEPSRFIAEIPMHLLMPVNRPTGVPKPTAKPAAESAPPDTLQTGMIVRHASFGKGVVLYTKGSGPKMRVRIRFQTGRTREFLAGHAPLEIVEARRR